MHADPAVDLDSHLFRLSGGWDLFNGEQIPNGTLTRRENRSYVYYNDQWIRYYAPPPDTLPNRKILIDNLTRRAFHHTEPGINTPGDRMELARTAYENQTNPAMKRVNAAMLAGALFNRATDLFTKIVELEELGVKVGRENELMKQCGQCFKDALELGTQVKHHSGEEGIDELWGEPFRAFTICMKDYYESRYIKVAQTMSNIDLLARTIKQTFRGRPEYADINGLVDEFCIAAKCECETMKSDTTNFDIWPRFVATGEKLADFQPDMPFDASRKCLYTMEHAQKTVRRGRDLMNWIARARVPMPKSTSDYLQQCQELKLRLANC